MKIRNTCNCYTFEIGDFSELVQSFRLVCVTKIIQAHELHFGSINIHIFKIILRKYDEHAVNILATVKVL